MDDSVTDNCCHVLDMMKIKKVRKLPRGTSDYQAAWILDEDDKTVAVRLISFQVNHNINITLGQLGCPILHDTYNMIGQ